MPLPDRYRKGVEDKVVRALDRIRKHLRDDYNHVIAPPHDLDGYREVVWLAYRGQIHELDVIRSGCSIANCVEPTHLVRSNEAFRKKKSGKVQCPMCGKTWRSPDKVNIKFCRLPRKCKMRATGELSWNGGSLPSTRQVDAARKRLEANKLAMLRATKQTSLRTLCLAAKAKLELTKCR